MLHVMCSIGLSLLFLGDERCKSLADMATNSWHDLFHHEGFAAFTWELKVSIASFIFERCEVMSGSLVPCFSYHQRCITEITRGYRGTAHSIDSSRVLADWERGERERYILYIYYRDWSTDVQRPMQGLVWRNLDPRIRLCAALYTHFRYLNGPFKRLFCRCWSSSSFNRFRVSSWWAQDHRMKESRSPVLSAHNLGLAAVA